MRDFDSLFLENIYGLIYENKYNLLNEGRKEVKHTLVKILGEDQEELVETLLNLDPTGSKNDCIRLAKYLKEKADPKELVGLAKIFFGMKVTSQAGLDINRFRSYKDFATYVKNEGVRTMIGFVDGNTKDYDRMKKPEDRTEYIKNNSEYQQILQADESEDKSDAFFIARIYASGRKNDLQLDDVIHAYQAYVTLGNVEDYKPLQSFKNFDQLNTYVNENTGTQRVAGETSKKELENEAIYEDDNIKVWRMDNVRDSINYTHNIGIGKHSWCIGNPINVQGSQGNQFKYYSFRDYSDINGRNPKIGSTFYTINIKSIADKDRGNGYFTIQARPYDLFDYTPAENYTQSGFTWERLLDEKVPEFKRLRPTHNQKYQPVKIKPNINDEDIVNYNPQAIVNKRENVPAPTTITDYHQIFKFIEPSDRAIKKVELFHKISDSRPFDETAYNELTPGEKEEYFQLGFPVNIRIWNDLSEKTKNAFISTGKKVDPEIFATLSRALKGTWERARKGFLSVNLADKGVNWSQSLDKNDLPIIMKNANLFNLVLKNPSATETVLNLVAGTEFANDNRVVQLIMASPQRAANHILQEVRSGKNIQDIDPRYFDGVANDSNIAKNVLKNILGNNIDFQHLPQNIIRIIVGADNDPNGGVPELAAQYIKWWVKSDRNITDINPAFLKVLGKNDREVDNYLVPTIETIIRKGQGDDLLGMPNLPDIYQYMYGYAMENAEGEEFD